MVHPLPVSIHVRPEGRVIHISRPGCHKSHRVSIRIGMTYSKGSEKVPRYDKKGSLNLSGFVARAKRAKELSISRSIPESCPEELLSHAMALRRPPTLQSCRVRLVAWLGNWAYTSAPALGGAGGYAMLLSPTRWSARGRARSKRRLSITPRATRGKPSNHTQKEDARGEVHEHRVECLFALLKPSLRVFRGLSKYTLPGYVGFLQFLRNVRQQNACEQAELILRAMLDPAMAGRARRGEFVKCLDHFGLLQIALN
jgi:hypothetical protein